MSTISAQKRSINAVCDEFLSLNMCSSLSSGTHLKAVEGIFSPSTNNIQTFLSPGNPLNYKSAKLYFGAPKNGKPDLSRQWFVYYSFRNPSTGKLERQLPIYRDINTFDTIGERQHYGRLIIIAIDNVLKAGFNPYEEFVSKEDGSLDKNILSCIKFYLSEKEKSLAKKSFTPYKQHLGWFTDWLNDTRLTHLNIDQIKRYQIMKFLSDYRERSEKWASEVKPAPKRKPAKNAPPKSDRKPASNRQINNIKDNINSFFNYFKTNFEDEVPKNPAKGIPDLPHKTQGNKAYTDKQINLLKSLMLEHNPRMLTFCEMVYESCTRPHEEARLLKVMDLEFDLNRIHIRPELSKEGRSEYIPMSARYMLQLKEYVADYPEDYFLFSIDRHPGDNRYNRIKVQALTPGPAPISEWTLREWYKSIKRMAGLNETWSIYSWVHSYCVRAYLDTKDVYFIQMKKRHTLLSTTCNYLRGLGLFVDLNQIADNVRGI